MVAGGGGGGGSNGNTCGAPGFSEPGGPGGVQLGTMDAATCDFTTIAGTVIVTKALGGFTETASTRVRATPPFDSGQDR